MGQPAFAVRHADRVDDHLDALVEGRAPDRRGSAPTGAVETEALAVDPLDRFQISERVVDVLCLFERPMPAAFALTLAEAAMIGRDHEVALLPQPARHIHAVDLLHAGVAVQADQRRARRIPWAPVARRVEMGGDGQPIAVVGDILPDFLSLAH
jgi:hypothetical protein